MDWISCSSSLLSLKDEPKHSFNQVPLFVSHMLTLDTDHNKLAMKSYIAKLKAQAALQQEAACTKAKPLPKAWEPLESQISRWWANLPESMRNREFQITEIAAACHGRFRDRPAFRVVAAALRSLGWTPARDWRRLSGIRRLWVKNECFDWSKK